MVIGASRARRDWDDWLTLQLKMAMGNKKEQHGTLSVVWVEDVLDDGREERRNWRE